MNLNSYLYTVNKNNGFKLSEDELKDVKQEILIYLSTKSYNDLLQKKTVVSYYRNACNVKMNYSKAVDSYKVETEFYEMEDPDRDPDQERKSKIKNLKLTDLQKKIINYLLKGKKYSDIMKKLKLERKQFDMQLYFIRKNNIPA